MDAVHTHVQTKKLAGKIRFLAYACCLMLFLALGFWTQHNLSNRLYRAWYHYGEEGTLVYLDDLNEEEHQKVFDLFTSGKYPCSILLKTDDTDNVLHLSLSGDAAAFSELELFGVSLLDRDMIDSVVREQCFYSNESTLPGGEKWARMPSVAYTSGKVRLQSLSVRFSRTHSMNGTYYVNASDQEETGKLLHDLSRVTGRDEKTLLTPLSGQFFFESAHPFLYALLAVIAALILFFVLMILLVQSYPSWSSLALLGWGKTEFLGQLLRPIGAFALVLLLVLPFLFLLLGGFYQLHWLFLGFFLAASALALLIIVLLTGLSLLLLFRISAIRAIKKQYSLKAMKVMIGLFYLLLSLLTAYMGKVMEGPVHDLTYNKKLQDAWKDYEEIYVLSTVTVGNDMESVTGHSSKLEDDMIRWFGSFQGESGVFLSRSTYFGQDYIDYAKSSLDSIYKTPLEKPLRVIAGDLNYAKFLGVEMGPESIDQLQRGGRVYLLPSDWSAARRNNVRAFLLELEQPTQAQHEAILPESLFLEGLPESVFTWTQDAELDVYTDDAVLEIYNSGKPEEQELRNLGTVGLLSTIKMTDAELAERVTQAKYLRSFGLEDNELQFTTIRDVSRHLRKSLSSIVATFALIIFSLLAANLFYLTSLRSIIRLSDYETLFVQYLLGDSRLRRYRLLFGFWIIGLLLQIVIAVAMHSYVAGLLTLVSSMFFLFMIFILTNETELSRYRSQGKD